MMTRQLKAVLLKHSYLCAVWWGVTHWCSGRGQGHELVAVSKETGNSTLEKDDRSTAPFLEKHEAFTTWQAKAAFRKTCPVLSIRDKTVKVKGVFCFKGLPLSAKLLLKEEWEIKVKRKEGVVKNG